MTYLSVPLISNYIAMFELPDATVNVQLKRSSDNIYFYIRG